MNDIWLVGAGGMARDYDKVLKALGVPHTVIGRGESSAAQFESATGTTVTRGGLGRHLATGARPPARAIVAVGVEALAATTADLLRAGVGQILVEKPGGLRPGEIRDLNALADSAGATVIVAYNRRFYASVMAARQMIADDGGVTSYHFEFTEWSHVIRGLTKAPGVKEHWFLCNSTHVVDLAFVLGGAPKEISCYVAGGLDWHPSGAAFAGAGVSEADATFSYQANWAAPGRWSVEVLTRARRLVFRPMEKLKVQQIGSVALEPVPIDDVLDQDYKPGLFLQTRQFLDGRYEGMCTLGDQCAMLPTYCRMAGLE
jgi:predicted dehydrogenase